MSLGRFLAEAGISWDELMPSDVFDWLEWHARPVSTAGERVVSIGASRGAAPSTMNRRVAAARGLFEFAVMCGLLDQNPVPAPRRSSGLRARRSGLLGHAAGRRTPGPARLVRQDRPLPETVDAADIEVFLADLNTHRDRAITLAMLLGGLRAGEVRSLRLADVDMGMRQVTVVGKGVGVVDAHGVEIIHETFPNTGIGYAKAIDVLATHSVRLVGVEGSASWGAHVSIALVAAGFDAREVPASRSAAQRRARRLDKTDVIDAISTARALVAEPTLGPVQTLGVYDPLVAKIEAVLEHRRALVATRTLMLHHIGDQISKLPTEIRDQLSATGKIEGRLRRLANIDASHVSTPSGAYRLEWLQDFIDQDRSARREIRHLERHIDELLDEHGTTLRHEGGIGPIAAATLICEVGDPFRFSRESKLARWTGTGAVALSSGEGTGDPVKHRLDFRGNRRLNSVLHIASVTQARDLAEAQDYLARKRAEGKTRRDVRRAHKRHLANRVIRRMWRDELARTQQFTAAA